MRESVDDARKGAAGRVEGIAESIDAAADHLSEEDMTRLSGYVHDMAGKLTTLADDLRTKSGDEVLQDVKRMAHRNPALFLGSSVAIGFGLSRFARASAARDRQLPVPMDQARTDAGTTTASQATASSPSLTPSVSPGGGSTSPVAPAASASPGSRTSSPPYSPSRSAPDYGDLP